MAAIDPSVKRQGNPGRPSATPQAPTPLSGPGASSGYAPNGALMNQVQGVSGFAPSHLADLGQYFQRFQPDTRMPLSYETASQQYRAFAPDHSAPLRHDSGNYGPQQAAPESGENDWVSVPARKLNFFGGPSGMTRVKRSDLAAQNGGAFGVVGY